MPDQKSEAEKTTAQPTQQHKPLTRTPTADQVREALRTSVSLQKETPPRPKTHAELYVIEQLTSGVSKERQNELNEQLTRVWDFFDAANIKSYIAGGTGIDLLDGTWDRDHQDIDIAIMGGDRQKFYSAAIQAGFLITDSNRRSLNAEEIADSKTDNAFLFRTDEQGSTQFEVMFLNETAGGGIELTKHVAASRASFEEAITVRIAEREVVLQPPEVILFHKLTDGRRKDFLDAKKVWGTLQPLQRERLVKYLHHAGIRFVVDGKEITDIPTLFEAATQKDRALHQTFFEEKIKAFEDEISKDTMAHCDEIYEVKQRVKNRSEFFEAIVEKYQGFIPERRVVIEAMADILYQETAPSIEQFKAWAKKYVKLDEQVNQKVLHEYVAEKLWGVTSGSNRG